MASVFEFLHIKGRTAGSSNELSLDVLEHKSVEAQGKAGKSTKPPKPPKASQGSYHGVAGTTSLSGQAEVERRKKARQASRMRLYVVITVFLVVLIGAGVYAGIRLYEKQVDTTSQINALVDRLVEIDDAIVAIDRNMEDPLDEERAAERSTKLADIPKLTKKLDGVSDDAQSLLGLSLDERSEITVNQINKAVQARKEMLSTAQKAFKLSAEAANQEERANSIWNEVLNADQLVREAISASNKATTQDSTVKALEDIRLARDGFETASGELKLMADEYNVDFKDQQVYLAKKLEALDHAIATSEALVAGNREVAEAENDAYNDIDQEAADLAADLPPAIGDIVQKQFIRNMENCKEDYSRARSRAVDADSVIREYLGR